MHVGRFWLPSCFLSSASRTVAGGIIVLSVMSMHAYVGVLAGSFPLFRLRQLACRCVHPVNDINNAIVLF